MQRGTGGIYQRGRIWWISYYYQREQQRESTRSIQRRDAVNLLRRRISEIEERQFIPAKNRLSTFDQLATKLENDYTVNARRSLPTIKFHIAHLREFFGTDCSEDITGDRIAAYQVHRLSEKASRATVNREVAILGRMFTLAKLKRPDFKMLQENNVRQGFLEHRDFLTLLSNLVAYLKLFVEFLYYSGWRKGAAANAEWRDVDWSGRTIRLRAENSKNKQPWVLPLTGRLWEIIQERAKLRRLDCPYIFHHQGKPIGDFRKAWQTACVKSGLEGTLVHDLRRCAARNLSRAGVPETVAMKITGHTTNSMYRRYRIVDERDLREATERLQAHLRSQAKVKKVKAIQK